MPPAPEHVATTRPPSLLVYPTYLASQLSKAAQRTLSSRLAGHDLSPSHFGVLAAIADDGPRSQQQLADRLDHDKSHMVGYVDHLESLALVTRQPDPTDRRCRLIALTAAGERLVPELHRIDRGVQDDLFAALSTSERHQLADLLARVVADLDDRRLATPAGGGRG